MAGRTRAYAAQLDEVGHLVPTSTRQAGQTWLDDRRTQGLALQRGQREVMADKLQWCAARSINAAMLAQQVAADASAGRLNPAEAMLELRQLAAIVDRAEESVPEARELLDLLAGQDPLDAVDELLERFPPLAARIPPAPPLLVRRS